MKLLNVDSRLTARKELAAEWDCPADTMGDSAQMKMWLHKAVLQKLAANGGNIPKELLNEISEGEETLRPSLAIDQDRTGDA